jgi:hypothetical protein
MKSSPGWMPSYICGSFVNAERDHGGTGRGGLLASALLLGVCGVRCFFGHRLPEETDHSYGEPGTMEVGQKVTLTVWYAGKNRETQGSVGRNMFSFICIHIRYYSLMCIKK